MFSIVDLHAITIKQDPSELATWRKEMLASLLAVGLDPKRSIIFAQSSVRQHAELMWILSCGASMGYLGRMTQWKVRDNLQQNPTHSYADVVLRVNYPSRPTPPLSTPQTTKTP
jgi:tryptophanyl-tRNA synthetase